MKRRNKRNAARLMGIMTLFMSVFTVTYTVMYYRSLTDEGNSTDHSETIYRRLAAYSLDEMSNRNTKYDSNEEYTSNILPIEENLSDTKNESNADDRGNSSQYSLKSVTLPDNIRVLNTETGDIFSLPLEKYVECVVLAEMPTDAPIEALKAQAVASRTLAVRFMLDKDKSAHGGADICTSAAHCQGYKDIDAFSIKYGESVKNTVFAIKNAVTKTTGAVLVYNGEPIVAAFHASSGARTASGKEVWGGDVAYLTSVETDEMYNEALKGQVISTVYFSKDNFIKALSKAGIDGLEIYANTPFSQWISGITRTESGRAGSIRIAGVDVDGDVIRQALKLRSCDFSVSFSDDSISFTTVGYGHGVGMSQLGAVSMAMDGESFHSILSKYYPGCTAKIM